MSRPADEPPKDDATEQQPADTPAADDESTADQPATGAEAGTQPPPAGPRPGLPRRRGVTRAPGPEAGDGEAEAQALALARRIVDLSTDKKASDIVLLEIRELTTLADYFVICSAQSERQLGAIADGVAEGLRDEGIKPIGREGSAGAHWLLIDYGSVIVHVMGAPERDFYQLERLWADAPLLLRVQ